MKDSAADQAANRIPVCGLGFALIFYICVGADAHIGPRSMHVRNVELFGEFDGSHRADVGIGPYTFPAGFAENRNENPVCVSDARRLVSARSFLTRSSAPTGGAQSRVRAFFSFI